MAYGHLEPVEGLYVPVKEKEQIGTIKLYEIEIIYALLRGKTIT